MFTIDKSQFSFRFVPGMEASEGDKEHTLIKNRTPPLYRDTILSSGGDLRRGESREIDLYRTYKYCWLLI